MIAGQLANWQDHLSGPVWEKAFTFLRSLDADAPEERTDLDGDKMFAIVMSYPTRTREEANIETHDQYIDIQTSLVHAEGMNWFPRESLTACTEYDPVKEKTYYHLPDAPATLHIDNHPGQFVVFFPNDAHQCQLIVGDTIQHMKKVVVKIHVDLLK